MRDGVMDGLRGMFEEVGEAHVEAAFAEADGGVEGGEATETDVEWRHGCARAEVAVLVLEDGDERGWGVEFGGVRSWGARPFVLRRKELLGIWIDESGRGRRRWRKELQELAQRIGSGFFGHAREFVLVRAVEYRMIL